MNTENYFAFTNGELTDYVNVNNFDFLFKIMYGKGLFALISKFWHRLMRWLGLIDDGFCFGMSLCLYAFRKGYLKITDWDDGKYRYVNQLSLESVNNTYNLRLVDIIVMFQYLQYKVSFVDLLQVGQSKSLAFRKIRGEIYKDQASLITIQSKGYNHTLLGVNVNPGGITVYDSNKGGEDFISYTEDAWFYSELKDSGRNVRSIIRCQNSNCGLYFLEYLGNIQGIRYSILINNWVVYPKWLLWVCISAILILLIFKEYLGITIFVNGVLAFIVGWLFVCVIADLFKIQLKGGKLNGV